MRLASWNWIWYVLVGFLMGGGTVYLWHIIKERSIKLVWYELVMIILVFSIFLFMGQTFIASFGEGEPRAAWLTLLFMGTPMLIIGAAAARSIRSRIASPAPAEELA